MHSVAQAMVFFFFFFFFFFQADLSNAFVYCEPPQELTQKAAATSGMPPSPNPTAAEMALCASPLCGHLAGLKHIREQGCSNEWFPGI